MADFARLNDDELLRRSREQPEAFGAFYERHVRAVLAHLRRRGLGVEEALDLTAEIFAAALIASARYRPARRRPQPGCSASRGTSWRGTGAGRPPRTRRDAGSGWLG